MRVRIPAVILVAFAVAGCASPNAIRDVGPEDLARITRARVQIVDVALSRHALRTDATGDATFGIAPMAGAVPVGPVAGALGTGIAAGLIAAVLAYEGEVQRREGQALLAQDGRLPSQQLASAALQDELGRLQRKRTLIRLEAVSLLEQGAVEEKAPYADKSLVLLQVAFHQHFSTDLARLRLHFDVQGFDGTGAPVMRQRIYYLPVSVPGVTPKESLGSWTANDRALYRQHLELGMGALADTLNAALLSRPVLAQPPLTDAAPVLRRTSCYGGDYDAGIPMSEYAEGQLLPSRAEITLVRLARGDVLAFPACAPESGMQEKAG